MVRSVTQQKMVTRFLLSKDESEDEEEVFEDDIHHEEFHLLCEDCQSFWNDHRSLSLGSAFWHSPASHKGRKLLR